MSARDVAEGARRIDDIAAAGDSVCWIERRPDEGGRNVLVRRRPDGATETLTPAGYDVRGRVHEYGGGAFCLIDGREFRHAFVNFKDQRVYLAASGPPTPLTPADGAHYADLVFDPHRNRLLVVQERPDPAGGEPIAAIVAIPLPAAATAPPADSPPVSATNPASDPPPTTELVAGADFYSSPRLSPDGMQLAWLSWNHPDMPWDATELQLADLDDRGLPTAPRLIAGGDPASPEAVQQPSFDPQGRLTFVSDRTGWWNLYRLEDTRSVAVEKPADTDARSLGARTFWSASAEGGIRSLCPHDADFGIPPWLFTMSTYAHTDSGIVAACCEQGVWNLLLIPSAGDPTPIPTPYTSITWLRPAAPDTAIFLAAAPDRHAELVRLHLPSATAAPATPQLDILTTTGPLPDPRYLSTGQPIDFPSADGRRAYAFFYPPKNDGVLPPAGARPPLIVKSHGGPTSAAEHVYDPGVQYWTSRGFAVVDVNYGGSTGHGRAYRESLRGRWGIVDVEDCAAAAEALADRGEADAARLLIRGGSAGGYTTLAALAFKDTFAAGASHYGVADLAALARDTHKFESRYLDRLVGPYPERADLYRERSPLSARDGFSCPVVFFQGDEDRIVPPNQAEAMVEALRARGLPVAYLLFEGEQHGFRRTGNIVRALEAELSFYGQVLGFEPAGGIEPVTLL
ncbi:MAG: prolyl oligopeptidase family serine peptidase [Acidobacteria bacterium]|nr:prolyl oligopeptidase family serine peptidase [Acidobacteriota bacterium]